jgi:hypothetical protein
MKRGLWRLLRSTDLWVLLGYLGLTLLFTYPLTQHFTTHVPGDGRDDPALVWNLWWVKHALVDLHVNPLTTDFLFYPIGINLSFYTLTLLNGVISIPLQALFGLVAASNILLLLSFVLSGYGTYLLVRYLLHATPSPAGGGGPGWGYPHLAAFVAGIVYAFAACKLQYAALGQFNIASSQWIPVYVLFLLKMTERTPTLPPPPPATGEGWGGGSRPPSATGEGVGVEVGVAAGLFLLLAAYAEFTFASFLVLFTAVYLAYLWFADRQTILNRAFAVRLAVLGAVFLVGFAPVLTAMLQEMRVEGDYMMSGWGFADVFSADLLGFFVPSTLHPIFGAWAAAVSQRFTYTNFVYVGYTVLALAIFAALRLWRDKRLRFWVVSALTFFVLSLGPLLHIAGQAVFDLDGLPVRVPLPFILLHYVPFIKGNRYPSRLIIVVVLCLAVLVGYALAELAKVRRFSSRPAFALVAVSLAVLISFESLSIPLPLSDMRLPQIYQTIGQEAGSEPILQLPLSWRNSFRFIPDRFVGQPPTAVMFQQFYQTAHQRPILSGNTSRNPEFKFGYFIQAPIIRTIIDLEEGRPVSPEQIAADKAIAPQVLRFFGFRYVVIHPPLVGSPTEDYIRTIFPLEPIPADAGLSAYRVQLPAPEQPTIDLGSDLGRLYCGEGWGEPEATSPGSDYLWVQRQGARLFLPLSGTGERRLSIRAFSPDAGRSMTIWLNGTPVATVTLEQGWQQYTVTLPGARLHPGLNEVNLRFDRLLPLATVFAAGSSWEEDAPAVGHTIGQTGVSAPVNIVVRSAGLEAGGDFGFAHIYVDGQDVSPHRRGYNLAVIDPQSGQVEATGHFDTFDPASTQASIALMDFIRAVPTGHIVAAAVADEASHNLAEGAVDALRSIGVATDLRGRFRSGHAVIGVKGAAPGQALEASGRERPVSVWVGANVDTAAVGVAVDWVRVE